MNGDIPLYFNKTTNQLVRYDGTQVTFIPGPNATLKASGELEQTDQSNWIPVAWDATQNHLVYGVSHPKVGQQVTVTDMIDPSTSPSDIYLVTGQVFGLNFEIRPPIREFLQFDA